MHPLLLFFLITLAGSKPVSKQDAVNFLQTYGYLRPEPLSVYSSSEEEGEEAEDMETKIQKALKSYQRMVGIEQTGQFDARTLEKMAQPRCGVTDFGASLMDDYFLICKLLDLSNSTGKWGKQHVTYSIENHWPGISQSEARRDIRDAFAMWAAVIPLIFTEVEQGRGDIKISFSRGDHGDNSPFDGKGGKLGHAFFPVDSFRGILHLDSDEDWMIMNERNHSLRHTDLLRVVVHEIGHSLGISHLDDVNSIMAPYYAHPEDGRGNYVRPTLDGASIQAVWNLYLGSPIPRPPPPLPTTRPSRHGRLTTHSPITTPPHKPKEGGSVPHRPREGPSSPNHPQYCLKNVVAIARITKNRILAFPDSKHMVIVNALNKQVEGNMPVEKIFKIRPFEVSAAAYSRNDSMLLMFNGNMVFGYKFKAEQEKLVLAPDYPKIIKSNDDDSSWDTNAAFILPDGRRALISTDNRFAFYNEHNNTLKIMSDSINDHFPNMPEDVVGFADFNQGTHVGFTSTDVFKYNFETHSTEQLGKIHDHMGC